MIANVVVEETRMLFSNRPDPRASHIPLVGDSTLKGRRDELMLQTLTLTYHSILEHGHLARSTLASWL